MTAVALEPTTTPADAALAGVTIDSRACDALVESHMPLVGHLVRELANRLPSHVNRDDLVSAGMLALVLSARSFDESRGVPFARFAAIRIRGALTDQLRTLDWASRAVRGKARELESVRNTLAARLGRTPSREEIAQVMGVGTEDLDAIDADVHRASVLSLQGMSPEDDAPAVPSQSEGPEGLLLRREQIGLLRDAVAELPERLRTVVEEYFFAQRKMADIAAELGVTESRVSQLRSEALTMLRAGLKAADETPGTPAEAPAPSGRRAASAREAYCASVASRSTLATRLSATTAWGEIRTPMTMSARRAG